MSAWAIRFDWRVERACAVLAAGSVFDVAYYAEVFEMDEEETIGVFHTAACRLGISFCVGQLAPAMH